MAVSNGSVPFLSPAQSALNVNVNPANTGSQSRGEGGRGGGACQYDYSLNLTKVSILLQFQSYYSFNLTEVSILLQFQSSYSFNLTTVSILHLTKVSCCPIEPSLTNPIRTFLWKSGSKHINSFSLQAVRILQYAFYHNIIFLTGQTAAK